MSISLTPAAAERVRTFNWSGFDKAGKRLNGQIKSVDETYVRDQLRKRGVLRAKIRRKSALTESRQKVSAADVSYFTRQLATMMKAGVPLLQAFDIVARGSTNPRMTRLLNEIRGDVETGTSLSSSFRKHPLHFDALYCNLVEAGEAAGILEALLDRLQ